MSNMNFKPLGNNILIAPVKAKEKSEGGIIVPNPTGNHVNQGGVLAIGPDVEKVKVNDVVVLSEYMGVPFSTQGMDCFIVGEDEVLGTVGTMEGE